MGVVLFVMLLERWHVVLFAEVMEVEGVLRLGFGFLLVAFKVRTTKLEIKANLQQAAHWLDQTNHINRKSCFRNDY